MATGYLIPTAETSVELRERNSRFVGICAPAGAVAAARAFVDAVRRRHPDASHWAFAFAVGHGSSVTHGMSDDGEPSGTAGRPVLAVVQGSGLGDLVVVVVRWFGGTKLGTGGLVRAYTAAAQQVLAATPTARKVALRDVVVCLPWDRYDACRDAVQRAGDGVQIAAEEFGADARLHLRGAADEVEPLLHRLRDLTRGRAQVLSDTGRGDAPTP